MTSIKNRLLVLILGSVVIIWLVAASFTYIDARNELDEVLDAHLAQAASLLILQATHELDEVDTEHAPTIHKYSRQVAFQIWEKGKFLRLHSANAPREPLARPEFGFSSRMIDHQRWRVFTTWNDAGEYLVHVAEREDIRKALAREVVWNLLQPLLITLPLLALLLWLSISKGMQPLTALTRDVAKRAPDNLAAFETTGTPQEVAPLIERLNTLFSRIAAFMANERRFTADAAHELRTPVAVIKAQLQVALGAENDHVRQRAIGNAILGCDRATHLIEQLLTLARLDNLSTSDAVPCSLGQLAAETIAELAPEALDKEVNIELTESEAVCVQAMPALLHIMLRNLIDNAVRYTPSGTQVRVQVSKNNGRPMLIVTDNGAGVPDAQLKNLSKRFYRIPGTDASGSGLGLSIAKRIAEIHGAELQLANNKEEHGLQVTVRFAAC